MATPTTAGEMLALARAFLAEKGWPEARLDAELLVAHALGLSRLDLFLQLDRPLAAAEIARGREVLRARARGEPVAYVTGAREFYARSFRVGPGVLVPRPETELLVDLARAAAGAPAPGGTGAPAPGAGAPLAIADFGTGSGCIAVTLALELPRARVRALDNSVRALAYARENAERLGARIELDSGDGVAALRAACPGGVDLLVSNPPYVDPAERAALPRDVREHEPPEALFAPKGDPDFWVRELIGAARELVRPGGALLVELGIGQAPRALALASRAGMDARVHRDLAGVERVLVAEAARSVPGH